MKPAAETGAGYRGVVVCAALAVVAVIIGVTSVIADQSFLGFAAAVVGVAAAGIGALLDVRRRRVEDSLFDGACTGPPPPS